ncbi:MAG: right-handed parallel beta-helix repeat-containing protein [Kiritimatiellae bacterium]|nr:right-handed parallel beta-helix repeat-containing protein [Kiritimatiellia bacterium]
MNTGKLGLRAWAILAVAFLSAVAEAVDFTLDKSAQMRSLGDSFRYDLRPGLRLSCRVKFDESIEEQGQATILQKGGANSPGAYILRVDGPREGVKFSFFVNHAGTPEPRVSVPVKPVPGEWYDVAAGWDGTNSWLTVNGKTASLRREGPQTALACDGNLTLGPMVGTVSAPVATGPAVKEVDDASICAGFRISCAATFREPPSGELTIAYKKNEYWLRYDRLGDAAGCFNFFVFLDGRWEPRTSQQMDVELGRDYRLAAGWNGMESSLSVDGVFGLPAKRTGHCCPTNAPLLLGTKGKIDVTDFCIRNEKRPILSIGKFCTRELLPRLGTPAHLVATLSNVGVALDSCVLETKADGGASVTPARIELGRLEECADVPCAWTVDGGTNGAVNLAFSLLDGSGKVVWRAGKCLIFLPEKDPDYSAKAWNPPHSPTRTYHVDSADGDDARDGLTPATAWKSFANVTNLTLGPGERLLLKRGSVFNEELQLSAHGSAENWAEIGAYGEGIRPQIRRNRHINDRCGLILNPAYLAVRDLIFCNAGSGFSLVCDAPGTGHVLVERCLAHHIEGMYRFNSHGIPEWRDEPGAVGRGGRSCGIWAGGNRARYIVMRDCESYQCSSGFSVNGLDTFVTRMFCHDNYAHNTSPHPYNCASRSWMTDCLFDASGWHAAAGTMGVMLAGNCGYIIRGCHFVNQPDSGSPDQGGIDFECGGENCLVEECTFRNNAGASIEVLGLRSPQTRNVHIRRCKFDRNNYARKNGPAEIQVWGDPHTPLDVACSNGRIEDNGFVLIPGIPFYINESPTTNDWTLARNREFDFSEELDRAFPYVDPPSVSICSEVWTDKPAVALSATVSDNKSALAWEQTEGQNGVTFTRPNAPYTKATFPAVGDYRVALKADNGALWRTARTAVHVLPDGARTFKAWDFAKNLDMQGWRAENTGTAYEFLPNKNPFWNSKSHPVRIVCGDYLVVALQDTAEACLVTPDEVDVGVQCNGVRANAMRIRMQNHTSSRRMRLWWQTNSREPAWEEKNTVAFDVKPMEDDDTVYTVALPPVGNLKQLKLAFSAEGEKVTGTCRIDYIWLGRL